MDSDSGLCGFHFGFSLEVREKGQENARWLVPSFDGNRPPGNESAPLG